MVCFAKAAAAGALLFAGHTIATTSEGQLSTPKVLTPVAAPLPQVPTLPPYICQVFLGVVWPEEQKAWCCLHEDVGCPEVSKAKAAKVSSTTKAEGREEKTTTTEEVKLWSWEDEEADHAEKKKKNNKQQTNVAEQEATTKKKTERKTTARATTTSKAPTTSVATTTTALPTTTSVATSTTALPTTTSQTCDEPCTVSGVTATCRDQIQQASLSDFLGSADSCRLAHDMTVRQCHVCGGCSPEAVGCGVLELITTAAPTTTIPEGDACNAVCTLGEQPATCNARIRWSLDHVFEGKPHACRQAHEMVLGQCSVCSLCTVEESECGSKTAEAPAANQERLFDCSKGATMEWSEAKQVWCCEHHQTACDLVAKKQVFFQKKDSRTTPVQARHPGAYFAATYVGVAVVGTAIAMVFRGLQRRRQRSPVHENLVDDEVFSE